MRNDKPTTMDGYCPFRPVIKCDATCPLYGVHYITGSAGNVIDGCSIKLAATAIVAKYSGDDIQVKI